MFQLHNLKDKTKSAIRNWSQNIDVNNYEIHRDRLDGIRLRKLNKFILLNPDFDGLRDQLETHFSINDLRSSDLPSKLRLRIIFKHMLVDIPDNEEWVIDDLYDDISPSMFDLYTLQEERKEIERLIPKVVKTAPMVRRLKEINQNQDLIHQLGFRTFEELVKELLIHKGYEVELTPITHDRGHDLVAIKRIDGLAFKLVIECKRYASHRAVGVSKVREFCDVIEREEANKGIMITTSYYSRESLKRKNEKGNLLDLLDGKDIEGWIDDYVNNRAIVVKT